MSCRDLSEEKCWNPRDFQEDILNLFNSHGTRRLYPPRYEMAVYCQDINYVFLVPKNSVRGLKNVISGEIYSEKFFWNISMEPKDSSSNFRGSLLGYF